MNKLTPYPKQEEAIQRMMAEPTKSILLASEMSQGKTLVLVEFALRSKFNRVLIVGVKDTFQQFHDRILAQSDGAVTLRRIDSTAAGKKNEAALEWGEPGWYFIGQQLFTSRDWKRQEVTDGNGETKKVSVRTKRWQNLELDLLALDEAHMAGAYGSNGQKTIHSTRGTWNVAMSGTFYGNSFSNAWAPTRWLWPDIVPASYWLWKQDHVQEEVILKRNGQPMQTPNGRVLKSEIGEIPPEGQFVASLPCYIRHVGNDPVPKPKIIDVELSPEQRRMYNALENDLLVWIKDHPFTVDFPATLRSRLRTATLAQFDFELVWNKKKGREIQEIFFPDNAESTKLDALWDELALYPDDNVILGTDSKKFAKLTVARMVARGMKAVEWSGDVSSKGRDEIKRKFLAGEIQYIVTVMSSFAAGLDFAQQNCWRMGVLSESDNMTTNAQWVRRVFRTGPHKDKFEWFKIAAINTYDHGQFANLQLQELAQKMTLGRTN